MSDAATQTAEERIAELEGKVEDLTHENQKLEKENINLERDVEKRDETISDLERTVDNLESEVSRLTNDEGLTATLGLYADPANWDGDRRFVPVMKHIDADDPYWPARQALNRAGI